MRGGPHAGLLGRSLIVSTMQKTMCPPLNLCALPIVYRHHILLYRRQLFLLQLKQQGICKARSELKHSLQDKRNGFTYLFFLS